MKQSYHLHYRGDFSLLSMDLLLHDTQYFDIDYVFLYTPQPRCFSGYLSKKGMRQMEQLGINKILKNKKWQSLFEQSINTFSHVDALKNRSIPRIGTKKFTSFWSNVRTYAHRITDSYIYCDHPVHKGLEPLIGTPDVYDTLSTIGNHKLEAHKRLSILEHVLHSIVLQCGKKKHLPIADLEMMTQTEFNRALTDKITVIPPSIRNRKKGFVWFKEKNKWMIKTGSEYVAWKKRLLPPEDVIQVAGAVTYAGKKLIVGKAKVHLSFSGTTNIKPGDILITGMTNPQLIPMLKHAAAIVTDEGGLMCHAAIISRELKIPCIVGTQDATQIFKNGDQIQVNTQTGVVTKMQ